MSEQPVEDLPAIDAEPELEDHPEWLDENEALRGLAAYRAVNDLDDLDDGMGFE